MPYQEIDSYQSIWLIFCAAGAQLAHGRRTVGAQLAHGRRTVGAQFKTLVVKEFE